MKKMWETWRKPLLWLAVLGVLVLYICQDVLPRLLYYCVTVEFLACWGGLNFLLGDGTTPDWEVKGVKRELQRRCSRRLGAIFFAVAAVGPLGWLLTAFAAFDTDFIFLLQGIALRAAAMLSLALRLFWPKRVAAPR